MENSKRKIKKGLSISHLCRYTLQVSKECYFVKTEMKRTVRVGTFTNKQIYFSMEAEAQFKEEKYYGNGSTAQSYSDER